MGCMDSTVERSRVESATRHRVIAPGTVARFLGDEGRPPTTRIRNGRERRPSQALRWTSVSRRTSGTLDVPGAFRILGVHPLPPASFRKPRSSGCREPERAFAGILPTRLLDHQAPPLPGTQPDGDGSPVAPTKAYLKALVTTRSGMSPRGTSPNVQPERLHLPPEHTSAPCGEEERICSQRLPPRTPPASTELTSSQEIEGGGRGGGWWWMMCMYLPGSPPRRALQAAGLRHVADWKPASRLESLAGCFLHPVVDLPD